MEFEWDDTKAESNFKKHGVRFSEAATIWLDTNALEMPDIEHSQDEARWIRLGLSHKWKAIVVVYVEKVEGKKLRIISARKAEKSEEKIYSERLKL